jgi:hypothetical protein
MARWRCAIDRRAPHLPECTIPRADGLQGRTGATGFKVRRCIRVRPPRANLCAASSCVHVLPSAPFNPAPAHPARRSSFEFAQRWGRRMGYFGRPATAPGGRQVQGASSLEVPRVTPGRRPSRRRSRVPWVDGAVTVDAVHSRSPHTGTVAPCTCPDSTCVLSPARCVGHVGWIGAVHEECDHPPAPRCPLSACGTRSAACDCRARANCTRECLVHCDWQGYAGTCAPGWVATTGNGMSHLAGNECYPPALLLRRPVTHFDWPGRLGAPGLLGDPRVGAPRLLGTGSGPRLLGAGSGPRLLGAGLVCQG